MSNAQVIREFLGRFDEVPVGECLVMEDNDQVYQLVEVEFRRSDSRNLKLYRWEAACAVCGEDFETRTPMRFEALTRTCPEHRRQGFAKPGRVRKARRVRATPIKDAVCVALDTASLATDRIPLATLAAMIHLPEGTGRDTRRQRIVRAIRDMAGRDFHLLDDLVLLSPSATCCSCCNS